MMLYLKTYILKMYEDYRYVIRNVTNAVIYFYILKKEVWKYFLTSFTVDLIDNLLSCACLKLYKDTNNALFSKITPKSS